MNTIDQQLAKISGEGRIGLMTHIVIGYPTFEASINLAVLMASAGVDFIELQIPFTDPIADGPTIMRASDTALQNGIDTERCFEAMSAISARVKIPVLFMTYYNIVHSYGSTAFCKKAAAVGAQGLIVPDMPMAEEKFEGFYEATKQAGLQVISVLAPENQPDRISEISENSGSILYLPSHTGVTGAKSEFAEHLGDELRKIKSITNKAIAVGFGVSAPQHIDLIKRSGADIAVVGSAVIDTLEKRGTAGVQQFLYELTDSCRK
ncbi:tryptophan synthase subunit alpha [Agrobacterium vitis]|uniref:tryptophan synthase subunit alpha n=1 Tax=Agrobacterium vitis TaxID=373 RepID=UPI0012E7B284|nr:tryptophan synthase subunit alpha [Agrobacterium vitis]MUZ64362.1 tryptophan synthase subunit alpha [Agrobacterium vitis]